MNLAEENLLWGLFRRSLGTLEELVHLSGTDDWSDSGRVKDALDDARKILADAGWKPTICPECGEPRPDDDRVRAGMKCGPCAY